MRTSTIALKGLTAVGTHGVLDFEHTEPQPFVVDVVMEVWTEVAAKTDDISDTVSYADVADTIVRVIQGEHCDLIETLANRIADALMQPRIHHLMVTVHKPSAPIPHTFGDVSVTVTREGPLVWCDGEIVAVVALGSNLENPREQLVDAIHQLAAEHTIEAVSSFYRTAPMLDAGQAQQPEYWNAVVRLRAFLPPTLLIEMLQRIEALHGRERKEHWGARTLDLDVIDIRPKRDSDGQLGASLVSDAPELMLPHPRAHQRRFVLEPWLEIEPDAVLSGVPVAHWLEVESGIDGRPVREQSLVKMDRMDLAQLPDLGPYLDYPFGDNVCDDAGIGSIAGSEPSAGSQPSAGSEPPDGPEPADGSSRGNQAADE